MNAKQLQTHLCSLADSGTANQSRKFFKTGKGDYGEEEKFLGIRVPVLRAETKKHIDMPLDEVSKLVKASYHEVRLFGLLLLVRQFNRADAASRKAIYELYMRDIDYINNWDLVDSSAYKIVGVYLYDRSRAPLYDLVKSENMWKRRVAIISTLHFIKASDFTDTLKIAKVLLNDKEDLIHKAVGWMLREVGNRDRDIEEKFLQDHYHDMPRTMLRYAIEKFPEPKRKAYLKGLA